MLIPPVATRLHSLFSAWLAFGAGHWRGQYKRSSCCIAHDRPGPSQAGRSRPMGHMLGSGQVAWSPGPRGPCWEVRVETQPALPCGLVTRGVPQENNRVHSSCAVHPPGHTLLQGVVWSPGTQPWAPLGTRGHEDRAAKDFS